jgi:predicted nucleotidyltransferase
LWFRGGKKFWEGLVRFCQNSLMLISDTFSVLSLERGFRDVDVAIYVRGEYDSYGLMKFSIRVARTLENKVQPRMEFGVKDLNTFPITFQYEVIKSGRLVFSRDNVKRVRFEAGVLSTYIS